MGTESLLLAHPLSSHPRTPWEGTFWVLLILHFCRGALAGGGLLPDVPQQEVGTLCAPELGPQGQAAWQACESWSVVRSWSCGFLGSHALGKLPSPTSWAYGCVLEVHLRLCASHKTQLSREWGARRVL